MENDSTKSMDLSKLTKLVLHHEEYLRKINKIALCDPDVVACELEKLSQRIRNIEKFLDIDPNEDFDCVWCGKAVFGGRYLYCSRDCGNFAENPCPDNCDQGKVVMNGEFVICGTCKGHGHMWRVNKENDEVK